MQGKISLDKRPSHKIAEFDKLYSKKILERTKDDSVDAVEEIKLEQDADDATSEEESELTDLLEKLSPRSKQQVHSDVDAHGGEQNFMMSFNFFKDMLDHERTTTFFSERKKAFRAMIDSMTQRTRTLDWLLTIAAICNISDEAFFHAVHLAESALTHFHLKT